MCGIDLVKLGWRRLQTRAKIVMLIRKLSGKTTFRDLDTLF